MISLRGTSTIIITAVAQFVSMLFGKTLQQSRDGAKALYKEANAIGAVLAAYRRNMELGR